MNGGLSTNPIAKAKIKTQTAVLPVNHVSLHSQRLFVIHAKAIPALNTYCCGKTVLDVREISWTYFTLLKWLLESDDRQVSSGFTLSCSIGDGWWDILEGLYALRWGEFDRWFSSKWEMKSSRWRNIKNDTSSRSYTTRFNRPFERKVLDRTNLYTICDGVDLKTKWFWGSSDYTLSALQYFSSATWSCTRYAGFEQMIRLFDNWIR